MWLLVGLFAARVVAQPLSLVVPFLPAFESWHSDAIPYCLLLAAQLVLLAAMGWTTWRLGAGGIEPRRSHGILALTIGTVYFMSMVARLLLGLIVFTDVRWFASPLPTAFHLVLASWLVLYGRYHSVPVTRAVAQSPR